MTSKFRIPAPLQNTIDNLAYLAATQDGDKLFFKEKIQIKENDWGARLRRLWHNENLENQYKIIKEIVNLGLDSFKTYESNVHYPRLVLEFFKARDGLANLRNTYLKQGRSVNELDTQIYIMQNQLDALSFEVKKKAGIVSEDEINNLLNPPQLLAANNGNTLNSESEEDVQEPEIEPDVDVFQKTTSTSINIPVPNKSHTPRFFSDPFIE
jgi:hypothetical protein